MIRRARWDMKAAAGVHEEPELERLYDELYKRYGKPLEHAHRGEYLAISPEGQTILGSTLIEVAQEATARFGQGNFIYKVGEKSVGKWR
jgi:hypothetical protein